MTGNLSDVAVTVVEEKKGEGEGPGALQGAGPGAERENLTLVKKDLTLGDHLGRARITMIEKKRRGLGGKEQPRMKGPHKMFQH